MEIRAGVAKQFAPARQVGERGYAEQVTALYEPDPENLAVRPLTADFDRVRHDPGLRLEPPAQRTVVGGGGGEPGLDAVADRGEERMAGVSGRSVAS